MAMRRQYTLPNDELGPETRPHLRLSRRGLGARLILPSNPISFLVNPLGCWPFATDTGEENDASDYARENLSGSESTLGPGSSETPAAKPAPRSTIGWGSRPGNPLATASTPTDRNTVVVSSPAKPSGSSLWQRVTGNR